MRIEMATIIDVLHKLSSLDELGKMPHVILKDHSSKRRGLKRIRMSIQLPTSAFITEGISPLRFKGKMPDYFDVAIWRDNRDTKKFKHFSKYTDSEMLISELNPRTVQYFTNVPAADIEEFIRKNNGIHSVVVHAENSLSLTLESV
jgi:hypothetical protein